MTAETEHALATGSQGPTPHSDGQDATALPKLSIEPAVQAPKLLDAIQNEEQHPEERFQGLVCLGWLHWVAKDYDQARLRLPRNFNEEYPQFSTLEKLSEWTKVCALKSAYLKANCLMRYDQRDEALQSLDASLPSLSAVWATRNARQALKYWAELVLTECCMLSSQALSVQQKSLEDANCLTCFRAWSKYWATQQVPFVGGHGFKGSVSRRQVWAEYYTVISQILQDDLAFPTGYAQVNSESSARSQLRAEVKKVDVIYSGLLFSETKFPRADEDRREVEDYVERLMQNWAVLAGRGWREQDLGPGGRESLSRGVLDSLYGAAMKTFHSTAILRHLFIVHLSVAEFDLAFKSFDSYLELVTKAKARMEKTGQPEPSLDDDAIVLQTISACISTLCRYGGREAAEKAKHLASDLEKWLAKLGQSVSGHEDAINSLREDGPVTSYPSIPPNVYALSWQSIGLAQAQWARMTYEPEVRAQLQERAIQCLRRSLYPEFGNAVDIRGVFALGLLYAEQRKLSTAIELIKTALLADSTPDVYQDLYNGPYWRERALIPLWHLLALMLSAREEFFLAARACEGAVEQFRDPYVLFGGRHLGGGYRSEHLAEAEAEEEDADGLVDDMDEYEREGLLEVKMTQLAILEVVEGPAVAVNASRELLSLFPRLFSDAEQRAAGIKGIQPPSTSSGGATSRGFRQSVFGGAKSIRSAKSSVAAARRSVINNELIPPTPQLPREASPAAPSIQVTGDKAGANRRSKKAESLQRRSRRDSSASRLRAHSAGGGPRDSESFFAPIQDLETPQSFNVAGKDVARTQSQASSMYSQSMAGRTSRQPSIASASVADMAVISMNEFETFAAFLPSVVFPEAHGKRRRRALLMRVWLLIAGFYRRAGLFANSQEACAEALRIVQGLEADMVKDETGSLSVRHAAWGEQKSMQELLADVWAEVCFSLTCGHRDTY